MFLSGNTIKNFKRPGFQAEVERIFRKHWESGESYLTNATYWPTISQLRAVRKDFRLYTFAITLFMLEAVFKSLKFFKSSFVYFLKPPFIFHRASIFHGLILDIIDLVCDNSDDKAAPLVPLVRRIEVNFDPDLIHYSSPGANQFFYLFKILMDFLQKESFKENPEFFELATYFNEIITDRNAEAKLHPRYANVFSKKNEFNRI